MNTAKPVFIVASDNGGGFRFTKTGSAMEERDKMNADRFESIDDAMMAILNAGDIPGAVVPLWLDEPKKNLDQPNQKELF